MGEAVVKPSPARVCAGCRTAELGGGFSEPARTYVYPSGWEVPYVVCSGCADLAPQGKTPPPWIVRAARDLKRAIGGVPQDVRFRNEKHAQGMLWRCLPEGSTSRLERVKVHGRGYEPDLAFMPYRGARVAIEVKLPDPKCINAEIARGLGQCLMYCTGSPRKLPHFDETREDAYYGTAALVIFKRVPKPRPYVSVHQVFGVHAFYVDFWLHVFHRECRA